MFSTRRAISTPLPRCPGGRRRGRSDSQYGDLSVASWIEVSPRDSSTYSSSSRATTRKPRTFSNHCMDCSKLLTQSSTQLVLSMFQMPFNLIRCQNTVCQQTQTAEIGETRSLGETCHHWQM